MRMRSSSSSISTSPSRSSSSRTPSTNSRARSAGSSGQSARSDTRPGYPTGGNGAQLVWPAMGTVYAIANQKGGVGKTTTAVNLAACTSAEGEQTLLVDLDPQCNATVALGGDRALHPSSYDCLTGDTEVAAAAGPAGPRNL